MRITLRSRLSRSNSFLCALPDDVLLFVLRDSRAKSKRQRAGLPVSWFDSTRLLVARLRPGLLPRDLQRSRVVDAGRYHCRIAGDWVFR